MAEAVADAAKAVKAAAGADFEKYAALNAARDEKSARSKKGIVREGVCLESERCLECETVCESCVDVCPNRANISVRSEGRPQIVHVDGLCNECGNCAVFCPYDSAPYREKFTLYWSEEDFLVGGNDGFLRLPNGRWAVRLGGESGEYDPECDNSELPAGIAALIRAFYEDCPALFL